MALTKCRFLMQVGQAGGFGAAYLSMQALGLMPSAVADAEPLAIAPGTGKGVKVVVLGCGTRASCPGV